MCLLKLPAAALITLKMFAEIVATHKSHYFLRVIQVFEFLGEGTTGEGGSIWQFLNFQGELLEIEGGGARFFCDPHKKYELSNFPTSFRAIF